jgi:hypothetical protein
VRQGTAHVLLSVPRDAGPMLVHAYDRRINHLHGRFMSGGQRLHDLVPDASPPPADEGDLTTVRLPVESAKPADFTSRARRRSIADRGCDP